MNDYFLKNKSKSNVVFLGIGGISMSALALCLKERGFNVGGFDRTIGHTTDLLKERGIKVNDQSIIESCDFAVVSSAISKTDENLLKLKSLNKPIISRAELLNEISKTFPSVIGISGTHGKTTCTALAAHIFYAAKLNFTVHVGGEDVSFGNYKSFGDDFFISEVCEYKRNLRYFSPSVGVVLNVDDDHLDSYGDFDSLKKEFYNYSKRSKVAVINADDVLYEIIKSDKKSNAVTFSLKDGKADYYAKNLCVKDGKLCMTVYEKGKELFSFSSMYLGLHDATNVLAATAAARVYNLSPIYLKRGIQDFRGVKRRNEIMGAYLGVKVIGDYAHHPTQIKVMLSEYEKKFASGYSVLFQPHTYSRTQRLFGEFVEALKNVKNLYVFETYAAREKFNEAGSSKTLCRSLKNANYAGKIENAGSIMDECAKTGKPVIVLGAGNLYDFIKNLLKKRKLNKTRV